MAARKYRYWVWLICPACGSPFLVHPNSADHRKTCSHRCSGYIRMNANHANREFREKVRAAFERTKANLNSDPEFCRRRSENFSAMLRTVGKGRSISEPQRILSEALNIPIEWNEYPVSTKTVRSRIKNLPYCYFLDIAHIPSKVCIEVDGPFHSHPDRKRLDDKKDHALRLLGWEVIRIPNDTVFTDLEATVERINEMIDARAAKSELQNLKAVAF